MKLLYAVSRVIHSSPRLSPASQTVVRNLRVHDLEHVIVRKFI